MKNIDILNDVCKAYSHMYLDIIQTLLDNVCTDELNTIEMTAAEEIFTCERAYVFVTEAGVKVYSYGGYPFKIKII